MKTLGIRFCGGCREAYDRTGWLRQLFAGLEARGCQMHPVYDLEQFPKVGLIICGCETQCLAQATCFPKQWHSVGPNSIFDNNYMSLDDILQILIDELHCSGKK